jgi:hypothetical protein
MSMDVAWAAVKSVAGVMPILVAKVVVQTGQLAISATVVILAAMGVSMVAAVADGVIQPMRLVPKVIQPMHLRRSTRRQRSRRPMRGQMERQRTIHQQTIRQQRMYHKEPTIQPTIPNRTTEQHGQDMSVTDPLIMMDEVEERCYQDMTAMDVLLHTENMTFTHILQV